MQKFSSSKRVGIGRLAQISAQKREIRVFKKSFL